jgi:transaldolase
VDQAVSIAGQAGAVLRRARAAGIDLDAVTADLEREGVCAFGESYRELLGCIEAKLSMHALDGQSAAAVW